MTLTSTTETVKKRFPFLQEYTVGEYYLSINNLTGKEADSLANEIKQAVINEFIALNPLLCKVYDFDIEESEVIYGSRKSRHKGKLKKKKGKTFGEKLKNGFNTVLLAITLTSTDYDKIPENWNKAVEKVEAIFNPTQNNININIEDIKSYPIDGDHDSKDFPENPNIT